MEQHAYILELEEKVKKRNLIIKQLREKIKKLEVDLWNAWKGLTGGNNGTLHNINCDTRYTSEQ
jgi:hypothetical protein